MDDINIDTLTKVVCAAGYSISDAYWDGVALVLKKTVTTSDGETLEIIDGYDVVPFTESEYHTVKKVTISSDVMKMVLRFNSDEANNFWKSIGVKYEDELYVMCED